MIDDMGRCESCGKIIPEGDLVLQGNEIRCKQDCADPEIGTDRDYPLKFGKGMKATLEALPEHEGCLYPGATMGEIKASGGTAYALTKAMEYGWANTYGTDNNREAPSYYRTKRGTRALNGHRKGKEG